MPLGMKGRALKASSCLPLSRSSRIRLMACSCLNLNFVRPRDAGEDGSEGRRPGSDGSGTGTVARSPWNVRKPQQRSALTYVTARERVPLFERLTGHLNHILKSVAGKRFGIFLQGEGLRFRLVFDWEERRIWLPVEPCGHLSDMSFKSR